MGDGLIPAWGEDPIPPSDPARHHQVGLEEIGDGGRRGRDGGRSSVPVHIHGRFEDLPEPPMPVIEGANAEVASTHYSRYRTRLSTHRTGLSEHRTGLSVNRTEMSSRRTGMSFQRTRMSADRTLMSIIRTALSMIGLGFTIYQVFKGLAAKGVLAHGDKAAGFFGQALVLLGVLLMTADIVHHLQFMLGLRRQREAMKMGELIHADSVLPVSITLIVAILLLLLGLGALARRCCAWGRSARR